MRPRRPHSGGRNFNIQYLEKIGRRGPMGRMDWRAGGWIEFRITRRADVLRVTDPRAGDWAGRGRRAWNVATWQGRQEVGGFKGERVFFCVRSGGGWGIFLAGLEFSQKIGIIINQPNQHMKKHSLILSVLALATAALLAGCASKGYEKGDKFSANIQSASTEIGALPGKIDDTLNALNDLVAKPQDDLRPAFKAFSDQLAGLKASALNIAAARKSMAGNGEAFLTQWDAQLAQIQNEDIKARSQARKDQVAQEMLDIKRSYAEADIAFKPFLADLQDVQKYLSVDLTPAGVATMKDTAAKATQAAGPLKDSIAKVAADFKALGVAMSSVKPAATP